MAVPRFSLLSFLILIACWQFTGCASSPVDKGHPSAKIKADNTGRKIVTAARSQLGTPYLYGGATPRGFDCSGLVYYAHREIGIAIPRSSQKQLKGSYPVPLSKLCPGDLVFFRLSLRKVSHVGIYAGKDRFIHAPSQGKKVQIASLNNPYWQKRLVAAGRFY